VAGARPGHSFGSSRQVLTGAGTHKAVVTMGCGPGLSASVVRSPSGGDLDSQHWWPGLPASVGLDNPAVVISEPQLRDLNPSIGGLELLVPVVSV